jgi:hypothetical protein
VRRPRRVAQAAAFVARGEVEQRWWSMASCGSPTVWNRRGMVVSVKSPGSAVSASAQVSGAETRASGLGRTEYAAAMVRSLAFWL